MRSMNPYIVSLGDGSRKTLTDLLSPMAVDPTVLQLKEFNAYQGLSADGISDYSEINSLDLNVPLLKVSRANKKTWDTLSEIERDISALEAISSGMSSSLGNAFTRSKATLDSINEMMVNRNTFDTVYIERFDNTGRTDRSQTDASINSGRLSLEAEVIGNFRTTIDVVDSNIPVDSVIGEDWSSSVVVTAHKRPHSVNDGRVIALQNNIQPVLETPQGFIVVLSASFETPKVLNRLLIKKVEGDVTEIVGITPSGTSVSIPISESVMSDGYMVVSFQDANLSAVNIKVVVNTPKARKRRAAKKKNRRRLPWRMGEIFPISQRKSLSKKIRALAFSSITLPRSIIRRKVTSKWDLEVRNGLWNNNDKLIEGHRRKERMTDNTDLVYTASIQVSASRVITHETGSWVSVPMKVEGSIDRFSISADEILKQGCSVSWFASVAGSQWIPIHPRNRELIENEALSFNGMGKAYLRFPAEPGEMIVSAIGSDLDGDLSYIKTQDGLKVIGVNYIGDTKKPIVATYRPASGMRIDPSLHGISTSSGQIIDATTGGLPGEKIDLNGGTEARLSHEPYVVMEPVPNIEVFADGVECTILSESQSLSDPVFDKVIACKITGKTIKFNKGVGNISVYYKYTEMSVRLKADLRSMDKTNGAVPIVDNVMYEVAHS